MQGSVRPRSIALRFIFTSSLLLAAGMACARARAIPAAQEQVFDYKTLTITQLSLKQGNRAPVRYYLSKPARKAPLVLFIQGSGCIPPFAGLGTSTPSSTLYSWIPLARGGRYAVMAVDKPYQSDAPHQGDSGTAVGCAGAFVQYFSYDAWLATLKHAVRHALTRPELDSTRV